MLEKRSDYIPCDTRESRYYDIVTRCTIPYPLGANGPPPPPLRPLPARDNLGQEHFHQVLPRLSRLHPPLPIPRSPQRRAQSVYFNGRVSVCLTNSGSWGMGRESARYTSTLLIDLQRSKCFFTFVTHSLPAARVGKLTVCSVVFCFLLT